MITEEMYNRLYAASSVICAFKGKSIVEKGLRDLCIRELYRAFPKQKNHIVFYNPKKKSMSKTPIYISRKEIINLCKLGLVPLPWEENIPKQVNNS